MGLMGNFDETDRKVIGADRQSQNLVQSGSRRRVPFDNNQLAAEAVTVCLLEKRFREELKTAQHIAAVIVIAAGYDKAYVARNAHDCAS